MKRPSQVRFNQIKFPSVPIQVGTARLLSGVTAEYKTEIGEEYRDEQKKAGPRLGDSTSHIMVTRVRVHATNKTYLCTTYRDRLKGGP